MDSFRIADDADGIVIVWFDCPGKSVNTLGAATLAELSQVIGQLEQTRPAGVVFASGKPGHFIAGADLFELREMDPPGIERFVREGQRILARLEGLAMPTVAAINGDCLGGGLELALACRHRVAAEEGWIKIGLPEEKLGILPAFGGTVRLTRAVGLAALPLLLAGKVLPPGKALQAGIVDEVVRPEALLDAARRLARSRATARGPGLWSRIAMGVPMLRRRVLDTVRRETVRRSGGHYPAPLKIIEVVEEGLTGGSAAGFEAERLAILELIRTDACRNLLRLFFLRHRAKHAAFTGLSSSPRSVEYAAVIGGGIMGAGIAHALCGAGIAVRLIEVNDSAVAAGLGRIKAMFDHDVREGRLSALESRQAMNRVAPTTQWSGLKVCDLAIEAVVEMEIKRDVFARLDKLTAPHAVLASNTSSLGIAEMAAATDHPARVVGMHFFNPVSRMPLVEIVRGPLSGDEALATAIALAGKLGKTPVLVRDAPGFLVNRVLIPYLTEAVLLARRGADVAAIDAAMKQFGWSMGPFELLDEVGLDTAGDVLRTLAGQRAEYEGIPQWLSRLLERGWLGKKSGLGFYQHEARAGREVELTVNPRLHEMWEGEAIAPMSEVEIQTRLMRPMVSEASRLLQEGVTQSAETIDLATVLGLGFPPFRGGLATYAETVGMGLAEGIRQPSPGVESQPHPSHT